jgi:hypothetical protein
MVRKSAVTFLPLVFLLSALAVVAPAAAQSTESGRVTGIVKDNQGGVVPGATVTLTGPSRLTTFVTTADGSFRFLDVLPGEYQITVELAGFARFTRTNIQMIVGASIDVPVAMQLATVEQEVTVSGASPLIDTRDMGTATTLTATELEAVPTSRDPWALLRTVPGVVTDRVNVAGNESGQMGSFIAKGHQGDTVWTMDGIVITDEGGGSPTYFNFDAFDQVQISTAGNDIKQPTGGIGYNLVLKRGTNQLRGSGNAYFTNHSLEAANVPDQLVARGVKPETANHNNQISDDNVDLGGPIIRNRAWFYGAYATQDVRVFRASGQYIDRTWFEQRTVKGEWQATKKDMLSVLYYKGDTDKVGRSPQDNGISIDAPTATWHQKEDFFPPGRPHGLLKIEDDRVFAPNLFLTCKYASYSTGWSEYAQGTPNVQAGQNLVLGQSFGSTRSWFTTRPQQTGSADLNYFTHLLGAEHNLQGGWSYRRFVQYLEQMWPGDGVLGLVVNANDSRARLYREEKYTNRTEYLNFYVADTISRDRVTVELGLRSDRQWGAALPSTAEGNRAFPSIVPGMVFAGYRTPFTWNNLSPRAGVSYKLNETGNTLVRASVSRYAARLTPGTVGYANASAANGYVDYRWVDLNGEHLVQPNEVLIGQGPIGFGGGFNPANPTAAVSPNVIDPGLTAPVVTNVVAGVERQVMANLAVHVTYTFTRTTNLIYTPWAGLTLADYAAGPTITGTLQNGASYSVPTFAPNAAVVAAHGNSRIEANRPGYGNQYHGVDFVVMKRLSNRWTMNLGASINDPTVFYGNRGVTSLGNPTPVDSDPLVSGAALAPRANGSYLNSLWQFNASGSYQLPWDLSMSGNMFGRHGSPFPVVRQASLGLDGTASVLVSPAVDTYRLDNLYNLDLRLAKRLKMNRLGLNLTADLFNVLNANTTLAAQTNIASPNFQLISLNLSPRILRFGVRVEF